MDDFQKFIKNFPKTGVLVIGDLIVDRYITGRVERISPEAPVPVVEVLDDNDMRLGGAANVAHNISSLSGKVYIAGVIGKDSAGQFLVKEFRKKGIDTDGIIVNTRRATTVKTRVYAHDQQVVRLDKETNSDIMGEDLSSILRYVRDYLPKIKAIILSDYCKGVITGNLVRNVIEINDSKAFTAVDPKIGHLEFYTGVDLITPNTEEASFFSGTKITGKESLMKAGRDLLEKVQSKAVLITQGPKGMTLFEKSGRIKSIEPSNVKEVYDVTGAGDTVIASFTLCHSAGAEMSEAAEFSNLAAGVVVGELGTAVVTRKDVINFRA